ncbi:cholecystokinin receptor type A-like [Ruditapes philippinarum]|uniref:cholecystokinin receptor type A-like n=1 Tax=Ruditapes philippinarum TaxID=129788 RepID=UPI00295AAB04|nr:cholecystokinin receptor type A-like [Ruditapes philippinarum]
MNVSIEDELYQRAQTRIIERILPVMLVVGSLLIVGIIGNVMTLLFYMKKTNRTVPAILIKYFAAADTATCTVGISLVAGKIMNISNNSRIFCKLTHFLGVWATTTSLFLLWIISIDRYRKICRPLGSQIAVSSTKSIGIYIVIFSFFLGARLLVTYDIFNVTLPNSNKTILTYQCLASSDGILKQIGHVFHIVDFLHYMMVLVTIFVTYPKIIYELIKHRKSMNKWNMVNVSSLKPRGTHDLSLATNVKETENKVNFPDGKTFITRKTIEDVNSDEKMTHERNVPIYSASQVLSTRQEHQTNLPKRSFQFSTARTPSEWNLTMMMFTVSALLILCFTPNVYLKLIVMWVMKNDKEHEFVPGMQFVWMLPLFNSVFNPIIYNIFNPKFRRYIASVIMICLRCDCQK